MEKPEFYSDDHKEFLDELLESGDMNVLNIELALMENFIGLTEEEANDVIEYWREPL